MVPGLGIVRGMLLTLRRFFQPPVTHRYPELAAVSAPRFRGRLQLLYDENGSLKCETCFQCAQACPVECIDMGGVDTRERFHVHWGAAETYGERREESALRRSGRTVPDTSADRFPAIDLGPVEAALDAHDYDPAHSLAIFEEIQAAYGYLPVAALKRFSEATGAGYAPLYGTASSYEHLRFEPPAQPDGVARVAGGVAGELPGVAGTVASPAADDVAFLGALDAALGGRGGSAGASASVGHA